MKKCIYLSLIFFSITFCNNMIFASNQYVPIDTNMLLKDTSLIKYIDTTLNNIKMTVYKCRDTLYLYVNNEWYTTPNISDDSSFREIAVINDRSIETVKLVAFDSIVVFSTVKDGYLYTLFAFKIVNNCILFFNKNNMQLLYSNFFEPIIEDAYSIIFNPKTKIIYSTYFSIELLNNGWDSKKYYYVNKIDLKNLKTKFITLKNINYEVYATWNNMKRFYKYIIKL